MVPADPDKTPKAHPPERRHGQRKKLAVEAELHTAGSAAPLRVKTADLSTIGCYVEMMFTLAVPCSVTPPALIGFTHHLAVHLYRLRPGR